MRISGIWGPIRKAKYLRAVQTSGERVLWHKLRAKRFHGLKFRRQVPIGSYVADFACLRKRLIVEIDGGDHMMRKDADRDRDFRLGIKGFTVLRFTNTQIRDSCEWVMGEIARACSLSLKGEGQGEGFR